VRRLLSIFDRLARVSLAVYNRGGKKKESTLFGCTIAKSDFFSPLFSCPCKTDVIAWKTEFVYLNLIKELVTIPFKL